MRIGEYELSAVECGYLGLDGGAMFGVVPKTLWQRTNPSDERNRIKLAMRALLVRGNGINLLVDCGAGRKLNEKLTDIYAVDYSESSLEVSLERLGTTTDEITHVVLTHLHFDHTGGATTQGENGNFIPTFPNAQYLIHRAQWETALNPTQRDKASYFNENYIVLEEEGLLNLIVTDGEILPGIELVVVNGHTPGQILPKISGENGTLLYAGDLIPTSSHVPIPYVMAYDLEPLATMDEKEEILTSAAEGNWTLFYEHDPEVAASKILKDEKGFRAGEEVTL